MLSDQDKALLYQARKALDAYLLTISGDAADINENAALLRPWTPGTQAYPITHPAGELRQYAAIPYRCITAHTHQGEENWDPLHATSLWAHYHGTSPETARPFAAEGHNPYMTGEYCVENGVVYRCKDDNVVHAPSVLPGSWEAV